MARFLFLKDEEPHYDIRLNGEELEVDCLFRYLGVMITQDVSLKAVVEEI